jgi:hypothetical protein
MTNVPIQRATLGPAQAALTRATEHLAVWRNGSGGAQVSAGHNAVTAVDSTLRALYDARAALMGKIRADQDATAARVDARLAEYRAEREDPETGEPLPRGVEGYRLGGER